MIICFFWGGFFVGVGGLLGFGVVGVVVVMEVEDKVEDVEW